MSIKQISSTSNATIKEIRKLHSRKERAATGCYLIEGIRIVGDAIQHCAPLEQLIFSPELLTSPFALDLVQKYAEKGGEVLELSADAFCSLAKKDHPQGLAAVGRMRYLELEQVGIETNSIWVVLDTVRDPGNLGTILRTLDGIGGTGVILLDDCVDAYDPTALRASMGGLFTQKIVRSTFDEFAQWKKANRITVVGTSDYEGRKHYRALKYPQPTFLMMGSERAGLPDSHLAICDEMVMIPMFGSCDSLNLAVATGVVLYEIAHQLKGETA